MNQIEFEKKLNSFEEVKPDKTDL